MEKSPRGEFTRAWAYQELVNNGLDWYVVEYADGSFDVKHSSGLSAILDCGHDPADYGIESLHRCWNGEEIGGCPF
jgi:hypothetical protein